MERLKNFLANVFCGDRLKNLCEDLFFFFFFGEHLRLCSWSLALASSIPVHGLKSVCPQKGCPWPWPRIFMSLALASSLMSSTPPLVLSNKWTQQYMKRSPDKHHLSMLQLHHLCVTSADDCHFYTKNEQASVACKVVSPWNTEFLWQHTLINVPFRSYQDLLSPNFEQEPDLLQRCAVALHANFQLWTCNDAIEQVLQRRSLKKHQIATYLSFV